MVKLLFLAFGLTCLLVVLAMASARWQIFGRRPKIPLQQIYSEGGIASLIDYASFERVVILISRCYKLDPEQLRPSDAFSGTLGRLDRWTLGDGQEMTALCILKEYPALRDVPTMDTIKDILVAIGEAEKGSGRA